MHVRRLDDTVVQASSTTGVLTLANAVPVGHTIVVTVGWTNDSAVIPTISSVVDTRGNTWEVASTSGTGSATGSSLIARATLTTAMQSTDTITVTIGAARIRWVLEANEFDDVLPAAVDRVAANHAPANSATPSVGPTALATQQPYELVVGAIVFGRGTGATSSVDPGWEGGAMVTTAAGSSDRALQTVWRYVTTTGTQSAQCTLSLSAGYTASLATFRAWTRAGSPVVPRGAVHRAAGW